MKVKTLLLPTITLLALSLLVGCDVITGSPSQAEKEIQALQEQMAQRGQQQAVRCYTVNEASKVAGFAVLGPAYLPTGFVNTSVYDVFPSGAGLPGNMQPKFNNTQVFSLYSYQPDPKYAIQLGQTTHKTLLGNSQPFDLGGRPAQRSGSGGKVTFGWEVGGHYLMMTGILGGTLTEDELVKVAASINPYYR